MRRRGSLVVELGRSWLEGSAAEVMTSMIGPERRSVMARCPRNNNRRLRQAGIRRAPSAPRRAAPGASPGAGGGARASVAPLKARLATVAKPVSSSRSASSRWAVRSAEGSDASSTRTHQQCTRRPPGRTSSAPASPTSQTPSSPRSVTRPVRACSSRASWPTRSPSSPSAGPPPRASPSRRRRGRTTFAPRLACSSGIAQRVRERERRDRRQPRLDRRPGRPPWPRTGRCGRPCSASTAARERAARARRRARRQATAARSGSAPALHPSPRRSGAAGSRGRRRRAAPSTWRA